MEHIEQIDISEIEEVQGDDWLSEERGVRWNGLTVYYGAEEPCQCDNL